MVSHQPLCALAELAAPYRPGLLGLTPGDVDALNDDRVGRMLDRLFDADRAIHTATNQTWNAVTTCSKAPNKSPPCSCIHRTASKRSPLQHQILDLLNIPATTYTRTTPPDTTRHHQ